MSLRDQLVSKGFASKKDKKRVERNLKQKRKQKQGKRQKKSQVERAQAAATEAAFQAKLEARMRGRKAREDERAQIEHDLRVRQMVIDSKVRVRGKVRFHFKKLNGRHIDFLSVSHKAAHKLRCGEVAIAALRGEDDRPETYEVVPKKTAKKLLEVEPELVVFFVDDTTGIDAPEEAFLEPEWEISLKPHRR